MDPCEICLCSRCFDSKTFNPEHGTCDSCNSGTCFARGIDAATTSCDSFDDEDDH